MKAARQQSQELQQTHQYINSILSADPKKEPPKPSPSAHVKVSPIKDMKTRFSEPPAPPPQQPLPEKPDGQPSLRRSETERPIGSISPVRDSKISSLADALSSARKEIEAQSVRMRDLEILLGEERRAREDAEERANRLERQSLQDRELPEPILVNGDSHPSESESQSEQEENTVLENGSASPPHIPDVATARLQQRLDSMMAEMNEMKQQMERYRQRAEDAEAESATHRKTLAEMVEKIREDDAKASKVAKRRSRGESELVAEASSPALDGSEEGDDSEEGEITIINEKDIGDGAGALLRRVGMSNGRAASHEDSAGLPKDAHALAVRSPNRNDLAMSHGAPAVSILTVVALGVAVMAYLNSYPRVER